MNTHNYNIYNQPGPYNSYNEVPLNPDQEVGSGGQEYDLYHVNYHQMDFDQWSAIPNDQTSYSNMWESPQEFEPEKFSENTKRVKSWNDLFWAILFWINFIATIILFSVLTSKYKKFEKENLLLNSDEEFTTSSLWKTVIVGIIIGLALTVGHSIYVIYAPSAYIKFGYILSIVFSLAIAIICAICKVHPIILIFPLLSGLIGIIMFCCIKKYLNVSGAILSLTAKIFKQYLLSIILLSIISLAFQVVISIFFLYMVYYIDVLDYSPGIYFYLLLSYLYITITFVYVCYMTISGLAASWYFLKNTNYFPTNPLWESFKRASTTSFGSASCAGFLLALIRAIRMIADSDDDDESNLLTCLRCVAVCIIQCIEGCIGYLNRYGLIYCSIYGVPYHEGCRRWTELSCHKFCNILINGNCTDIAMTFNGLVFTIIGSLIGYLIGYGTIKPKQDGGTFTAIFAFIFTLAFCMILNNPISTISDTIIVCFSEEPEKLKVSAIALYEQLSSFYNDRLSQKSNHH